jgi:two-component sensor histidine kinase
MATPLAVALAELIQNAIEHGFVEGAHQDGVSAGGSPRIDLVFEQRGDHYGVSVRDNGIGLPEGFDIDETRSLGLAIVRDLVRTQLGGTITMANDGGTVARVEVPVRRSEPRNPEATHP